MTEAGRKVMHKFKNGDYHEGWEEGFKVGRKTQEFKAALEKLYGYLLTANRDGEVHIPAEMGEYVEHLLGISE